MSKNPFEFVWVESAAVNTPVGAPPVLVTVNTTVSGVRLQDPTGCVGKTKLDGEMLRAATDRLTAAACA
jgi:hypothetical protein